MSTILKALRRLEQEREAKAERDLRDQVVARPERASGSESRLRIPLLVTAGAAGAVLVVVLVALIERGDQEALLAGSEAAPAVASTPAPLVPSQTRSSAPMRALPAPAPVPESAAPAAQAQVPLVRVAAQPAARPARRTSRMAPPPLVVPGAAVPAAPPEPKPAVGPGPAARIEPAPAPPLQPAAPVGPTPAAVALPSAATAPAPTPAEASQPEATNSPAASTSAAPAEPEKAAPVAPKEAELAPLVHESAGIAGQPELAARAPLPGLVVERTLWHPDPARRLAILQVEGREAPAELHEGDAVGDLVVQQIDPSGVLFLHRGVEIRRRVGARD